MVEDGFEFFYGFQEQHSHAAGPSLHHYRSCSLENVYKEKQVVWEEVLKKKIELPAPFLKIYNNCGEEQGTGRYRGRNGKQPQDRER